MADNLSIFEKEKILQSSIAAWSNFSLYVQFALFYARQRFLHKFLAWTNYFTILRRSESQLEWNIFFWEKCAIQTQTKDIQATTLCCCELLGCKQFVSPLVFAMTFTFHQLSLTAENGSKYAIKFRNGEFYVLRNIFFYFCFIAFS